MSEVKSLSATKVSCACRCPKQFSFRYVDKIPEMSVGVLLSGRVVHDLIEKALHRVILGATLPSTKDFDDWFNPTWEAQAKEEEEKPTFIAWDWDDDDPVGKAKEESRALARFALEEVLPTIRPKFVEHEFNFEVAGDDPFKIYGVIDVVEEAGFIDWKTAKKSPRVEKFPDLQFSCYGEWWRRDHHSDEPVKGRKISLVRGRKPHLSIQEFVIENAHREWFLSAARDVWRMCQAGAFPPNTGGWWCQQGWCSFYDGCMGELSK